MTIALTYTGTEEKHSFYKNWIKGNDAINILKLSAEENNLAMLQQADALVMSGGIDAHPQNYGSTITTYPNAPAEFNEARDVFETDAFKMALHLNIPVLAICRGMQLVNCILGGDLVQDLGPEKNKLHRNSETHQIHDVLITPGTLLHHITNKEKDITDSAHHQCINHVGKNLLINAISVDGIAEGIEWVDKKNKAFFLGVQWHPERMFKHNIESSSLSQNIREYFLAEVAKAKT